MSIQWFPGHMHKARKDIARALGITDAVIEVLDARLPASSANPMLDSMLQGKPRLKVLTRADLADPALTDRWLAALRDSHTTTLAIGLHDGQAGDRVMQALKAMPQAGRSIPRAPLAMVVGIPNVGKSTLINRLAGRCAAKTGNEPAITRQQQQIRLGEAGGNAWALLDTPGVMWPNVENRHSGFRLAASGAIRDTAMDSTDVALRLLDYLNPAYGDRLQARFGPSLPLSDSVQTLEAIGRQRGCLSAGALVDFDRSARLLLTELRAGQLGRLTLETPEMLEQELVQLEQERAKRDERRAAHKAQRAGRARRPGT